MTLRPAARVCTGFGKEESVDVEGLSEAEFGAKLQEILRGS